LVSRLLNALKPNVFIGNVVGFIYFGTASILDYPLGFEVFEIIKQVNLPA